MRESKRHPDSPTDRSTARMDRRDVLRGLTTLGAASYVVSGFTRTVDAAQEQAPADTTRFFPGFKPFKVEVTGATINGVVGGQGPPLLMLHGAPQTHVSWRLVAPKLAEQYTVVAPDLRGYGDSSKPADGESHANYSKRAMALDQVEVMKHFGFDRFPVVGHDRGGRVGHRMALDHAEKVVRLAVIDIIPTYYLYTHVTIEFVQAYFHWFNYLRPAPGPENDLKAQNDAQLARATTEIQREYLRTASRPENIHAMCEDYRAGASIDLKHDEADLSKKIACPLLALWGERAPMGRLYDVLAIWRERGTKVTAKGLPGGHTLQEDVPEQFLAELNGFLRA
jgi:haloacetate dehalogenase